MYTTTEAAALLNTARRNVQNYCKRHNITKRGRDYDISERDIEGIRSELGKVGRPKAIEQDSRGRCAPADTRRKSQKDTTTMATYATQSVGIDGETDVTVTTGIAHVPAGWNMTTEKAAQRSWLIGRISRKDRGGYHVTSYAQQTFQIDDWEVNQAADFGSYDEALGWIKAECNNVLERL